MYAATLDGKSIFLNDLGLRRWCTSQQRGGKYAHHAGGYDAETMNKNRTLTGFFYRSNPPNSSAVHEKYP